MSRRTEQRFNDAPRGKPLTPALSSHAGRGRDPRSGWVRGIAHAEKPDARLYRPAHSLDHPGHGGRRLVCLWSVASEPRRPGGDHRRRHRDPGRHRPHPPGARARRAALPPVRVVGVALAARRSRHLDLHQPPGHDPDRAAGRADRHPDDLDPGGLGGRGDPDGRAGGVEGRIVDRPDGHGVCRSRVFGAGLRPRLCADLSVGGAHRPVAGAGFRPPRTAVWGRSCRTSSCRPWRWPWSTPR